MTGDERQPGRMGMLEYLEGQLSGLPQPVRADIGRVLLTVVPHVTKKWTRRNGVGWWWVALSGAAGAGGEVRVQRANPMDFDPYYIDNIHQSFGPGVHQRIGDARCAALVYGSGYRSSMNYLPIVWSIDTFARVALEHESGVRASFDLPFARHGRLVERVRFDRGLLPILRGAACGD